MDSNNAIIKCFYCEKSQASKRCVEHGTVLCDECATMHTTKYMEFKNHCIIDLQGNGNNPTMDIDDISTSSNQPDVEESGTSGLEENFCFRELSQSSTLSLSSDDIHNDRSSEHCLNIDRLSLEDKKPSIPPYNLVNTSMKDDKLFESAMMFCILKDKNYIEIRMEVISCSVIGTTLFAMERWKKFIDVYDLESFRFKSQINCGQYFVEDPYPRSFFDNPIIAVGHHLFLQSDCINRTIVYKYNFKTNNFDEWKTIDVCCLSYTNRCTILARTLDQKIIEYSVNGKEIRKFEIPDIANIKRLYHPTIYIPSSYIPAHQLIDGRYVVVSYNSESFLISLLDAEGKFVASFSKKTNNIIRTCTDGEEYILVLEKPSGVLTVLLTRLNLLKEITCNVVVPDAENISYDQENNKIMIITSRNIFFYYISKRY